jgi:putative salt-induced outer membrane protein
MRRLPVLIAFFITALPTVALAQTAPAPAAQPDPPPPLWERSAEFSLVATGGNTDTQTLGLGAALTWRPGPWTTDARVTFVRSEAEDVETAESLLAELRQARKLSAALEAFGRFQYVVDRFAGIDYRTSLDGGIGWEIVAGTPHTLRVDAGVGVIREARLTGEDLTFPLGNAGAKWKWQLSEAAAVTEQALMTLDLSDAGNWRFTNGIGVTSALTRIFSLKLSHELKRVNEPAPGFRKTDTLLSAALVAKF